MKNEKNQLVVTDDPIQSALCQLVEGSDRVDIDSLAESMMPLILQHRSIEDLATERARQLVGRWVTNMVRVTPDGELIPAFVKTVEDGYKSVDQVNAQDLMDKQKQLEQRRVGMGVQIENLNGLGQQLGLPGMEDLEFDRDYDSEAERHFISKARSEGLELTHNKKVGRYKVDFSVVEDGQSTNCNISILGEKWHKNKLPHDFSRMRDLTDQGQLMIPFTARQVLADPSRCVSEVKSIFSKWKKALGQAVGS